MDKKQVEKVASLARLEFSKEEMEKISGQLINILDYIDQLKELDTSDTEPMGQPLGDLMKKLRLAEDSQSPFANTEKLTRIAPDFKDGFYKVKKVIE
ncbi:Asp-tRNA(Asn)/Glu-tRNA(Gln) amidotransferase subunit GatC [Elusimicrobiota bacterium]